MTTPTPRKRTPLAPDQRVMVVGLTVDDDAAYVGSPGMVQAVYADEPVTVRVMCATTRWPYGASRVFPEASLELDPALWCPLCNRDTLHTEAEHAKYHARERANARTDMTLDPDDRLPYETAEDQALRGAAARTFHVCNPSESTSADGVEWECSACGRPITPKAPCGCADCDTRCTLCGFPFADGADIANVRDRRTLSRGIAHAACQLGDPCCYDLIGD